MAVGNALPPQAYTRETLAQAYSWIQSQNEGLRKMATSPDTLVSLYLRHTRHCEAPQESQTFKADLKNLAENMRQFEERVDGPPAEIQWHKPSLADLLDNKTLKLLQDTKGALNLSSEIEACRALVALGFERLKALYKE